MSYWSSPSSPPASGDSTTTTASSSSASSTATPSSASSYTGSMQPGGEAAHLHTATSATATHTTQPLQRQLRHGGHAHDINSSNIIMATTTPVLLAEDDMHDRDDDEERALPSSSSSRSGGNRACKNDDGSHAYDRARATAAYAATHRGGRYKTHMHSSSKREDEDEEGGGGAIVLPPQLPCGDSAAATAAAAARPPSLAAVYVGCVLNELQLTFCSYEGSSVMMSSSSSSSSSAAVALSPSSSSAGAGAASASVLPPANVEVFVLPWLVAARTLVDGALRSRRLSMRLQQLCSNSSNNSSGVAVSCPLDCSVRELQSRLRTGLHYVLCSMLEKHSGGSNSSKYGHATHTGTHVSTLPLSTPRNAAAAASPSSATTTRRGDALSYADVLECVSRRLMRAWWRRAQLPVALQRAQPQQPPYTSVDDTLRSIDDAHAVLRDAVDAWMASFFTMHQFLHKTSDKVVRLLWLSRSPRGARAHDGDGDDTDSDSDVARTTTTVTTQPADKGSRHGSGHADGRDNDVSGDDDDDANDASDSASDVDESNEDDEGAETAPAASRCCAAHDDGADDGDAERVGDDSDGVAFAVVDVAATPQHSIDSHPRHDAQGHHSGTAANTTTRATTAATTRQRRRRASGGGVGRLARTARRQQRRQQRVATVTAAAVTGAQTAATTTTAAAVTAAAVASCELSEALYAFYVYATQEHRATDAHGHARGVVVPRSWLQQFVSWVKCTRAAATVTDNNDNNDNNDKGTWTTAMTVADAPGPLDTYSCVVSSPDKAGVRWLHKADVTTAEEATATARTTSDASDACHVAAAAAAVEYDVVPERLFRAWLAWFGGGPLFLTYGALTLRTRLIAALQPSWLSVKLSFCQRVTPRDGVPTEDRVTVFVEKALPHSTLAEVLRRGFELVRETEDEELMSSEVQQRWAVATCAATATAMVRVLLIAYSRSPDMDTMADDNEDSGAAAAAVYASRNVVPPYQVVDTASAPPLTLCGLLQRLHNDEQQQKQQQQQHDGNNTTASSSAAAQPLSPLAATALSLDLFLRTSADVTTHGSNAAAAAVTTTLPPVAAATSASAPVATAAAANSAGGAATTTTTTTSNSDNNDDGEAAYVTDEMVAQRGVCGLTNVGNTCYMNSALQCLSSLPLFRHALLALPLSHYPEAATTAALVAVLAQLWSGTSRYARTRELKDIFGKREHRFANCQQQDASEFVEVLLDRLNEELNTVAARRYRERRDDDKAVPPATLSQLCWRDFVANNTSIVPPLFFHQSKTLLRCLTCDESSVVFDNNVTLAVNIKQARRRRPIHVQLLLYVPDTRNNNITGSVSDKADTTSANDEECDVVASTHASHGPSLSRCVSISLVARVRVGDNDMLSSDDAAAAIREALMGSHAVRSRVRSIVRRDGVHGSGSGSNNNSSSSRQHSHTDVDNDDEEQQSQPHVRDVVDVDLAEHNSGSEASSAQHHAYHSHAQQQHRSNSDGNSSSSGGRSVAATADMEYVVHVPLVKERGYTNAYAVATMRPAHTTTAATTTTRTSGAAAAPAAAPRYLVNYILKRRGERYMSGDNIVAYAEVADVAAIQSAAAAATAAMMTQQPSSRGASGHVSVDKTQVVSSLHDVDDDDVASTRTRASLRARAPVSAHLIATALSVAQQALQPRYDAHAESDEEGVGGSGSNDDNDNDDDDVQQQMQRREQRRLRATAGVVQPPHVHVRLLVLFLARTQTIDVTQHAMRDGDAWLSELHGGGGSTSPSLAPAAATATATSSSLFACDEHAAAGHVQQQQPLRPINLYIEYDTANYDVRDAQLRRCVRLTAGDEQDKHGGSDVYDVDGSNDDCTLQSCLTEAMKPDTLTGSDAWYCPRCKAFRDTRVWRSLFRLPPCLFISFKRFKMNAYYADKNDTAVSFPLQLDFAPYLDAAAEREVVSTRYRLRSVIYHSGSLSFGHYTAMAYHDTAKSWVLYNDTNATVMTTTPPKRDAYILCYERVDTTDTPAATA